MKFKFTDEMKPIGSRKDKLHSSFPFMLIYVSENNGIAEVIQDEHFAKSLKTQRHFDPLHIHFSARQKRILMNAEKHQKNGATHIITGYYDVLDNHFVQLKTFEIPSVINDRFADEIINVFVLPTYNDMLLNKELWLTNLTWRDNNHISLHIDYIDLFKDIKHIDLHNSVIAFMDNPDEAFFERTIDGEQFLICNSLVAFVLKDLNLPTDINYHFAMQQVLEVNGYVENIMNHEKTDKFDYIDGRMGNFNLRDVMESDDAAEYHSQSFISERFLTLYPKK